MKRATAALALSKRIRIRAVRVAQGGAVFIQAQPTDLDLDSLPRSGQTDHALSDDDATGRTTTPQQSAAAASADPPTTLNGTAPVAARRRLGRVGTSTHGASGVQRGDSPGLLELLRHEQEQLQQRQHGDAAAARGGGTHRRRRQLVDDSYQGDVLVWPHTVIGRLTFSVRNDWYLCSGGYRSLTGLTDTRTDAKGMNGTRRAASGTAAWLLGWSPASAREGIKRDSERPSRHNNAVL
jgi:hypothetical protein